MVSKMKSTNPRLKMNPKFKAAQQMWDNLDGQLDSATNGEEKITYEIAQARKTGKLSLSSAGLESLPDAMFDIRNGLVDNMPENMDELNQLKKHEKAWECYGEDMLTMLDLSENNLSNATSFEKMSCYKSLVSLHLRNCSISTLPWDVLKKNLTSLKTLNLPGNNFTKVPLQLLPDNITTLNLADNNIDDLGENTVLLPKLYKLDLQNNKNLIRLPSNLCTPNLHHVCMSKCSIEVVPKKFLMSCKDTLITLDLANNQLSLPMNLVEHSALKTLELRFNKIKDVPVIHENLVQLGLFHNKITTIKELYPFLDQCDDLGKSKDGDWFRPNLRELHIGQNNLKKLDPQTMSVVTKLGLLDVTDNDLETFPPIVGYLRDLNKIVLDGNPFRMIRSAISYKPQGGIDTGKLLSSLRKKMVPPQGPGYHPDAGYVEPINGFDAATPQKVIEAKTLVRRAVEGQRTLNLDGRGNEGELVWPELIDALSCEKDDSTMGNKIAILNIADGKLTGFGTEWVNALPSLSEIDARRNCLVSLPSNLHQLPLKSIVCARNKLSSLILQDTICLIDTPLCSNLTDLDLSMNKLEWIPDGLFDLNTLRTLNLSKNNIKSLAWERDEQTGNERGWRHGLVSLEYLDLSNNRLHDLGYLPLALIGCQSLRTLLLNNNCIYDIPLEIGLLEQLLKIELLGNSQRKIATRTLTQSCSTILKYLRDRMDDSQITKARENHNEIFETLKEEYEIDIDKNYQKEDHVSVDKNNGIPPSNSIAEGKQSTPKPSTIVEAKQSTPKPSTVNSNKEASNSTLDIEGEQLLNQLEQQIEGFKKELMNLSLSKAKRFALKKSLAMHNSKLIRERRRLNEASS